MESSIYREGRAKGLAEGLAEGRAEGRLIAARELCRAAVRKWHPRASKKVWTAIERCTDVTMLKDVVLNAPEWDTRDILQRLTAVRGKNKH
jgi:hypothetical protein